MARSKWYQTWFNEIYLALYTHRDKKEAAAFVEFTLKHLAPKPGCLVLDLCCGTGRHMDIFLKKGFRVVGLDLSWFLLKKGARAGRRKRTVQGDMASLPFRACFDVVVNFFTSFGYYETDRRNREVLSQVRGVLRPGGKFLLDLPNACHVVRTLVRRDVRRLGGKRVIQIRAYNRKTRRMEKTIRVVSPKGEKRFRESVRLYSQREIARMARTAGLRVSAFMDLAGGPLSPASDRMLVIGERPC